MVLGYGVIAVPTGIVTAEISYRVLGSRNRSNMKCPVCGASDLQENSSFCYNCGSAIKSQEMN